MVNTNKFFLQTKAGVTIDLVLYDKTSIIVGDSAMLKLLKALRKNKSEVV